MHTDGFEETNSKNYLKSTNTGTITITPSEGYEVRGNMGAGQAGTNFTYTLERNDNSVIVTLSSPEGAVTISPEALNLIIALIQQVNPDPQPQQPEQQQELQPEQQQQAEAQPQPVQIIVRVVNETSGNSESNSQQVTVMDIDLGDDPSLDADAIKELCAGGVAKRCHFTHDGKKYMLYVPVVDLGSTTFANCLALLADEPGGSAGPIKVSQIFAPCGFSVSEE